MEREKQELRDYLEKDKKAMTDKMSAEEAERQRKEKEMAVCSNHRISKGSYKICYPRTLPKKNKQNNSIKLGKKIEFVLLEESLA